jgi:hypothetical protein
MKFFIKTFTVTLIFICIGCISGVQDSRAYMSSPNYINWMDSLNFGGEESSSSASYRMQDTLGEMGTGKITSANYAGLIGFRQSESDPKFTFTISANLIDFGPLTVGSVFTDSVTVTTTTNSVDGYFTTIVEDGEFRTVDGDDINDVTDGTVSAGSEEYGIRTSGTHGQMNGADTAILSTPQNVADYTSWINGDATTVTFKASIAVTTVAGYYEHNVTLISTGRF